ncbi:MAG: dihydroorotase, partial [Planctomycetes bacterium]|nr:dihydroorotase [Planctomycetota bacterium]
ATGAQAALNGGFTSIACMPNTRPPLDTEAQVEYVVVQGKRASLAKVYPIAAITRGRQGEELSEMGALAQAGAVAFSDDGDPVASAGVMSQALQYSKMFNRPLLCHEEDKSISGAGVMHAGFISMKLGLPGIPASAEEVMVARDIILARHTGGRVHICHISTAGSVEIVRRAKADGLPVTAEACPHHFTLTDEACAGYNPAYKMNPPLRVPEDVEAVIAGLVDGAIDVIATDHAPHTEEEKALEFPYAPMGIIGLETCLGLAIARLVKPGHLTLPRLIEKMSLNPSRILRLPGGTLSIGAPADITIFHPDEEWTVDKRRFRSKSRNTPFDAWKLTGKPRFAVCDGKVFKSEL